VQAHPAGIAQALIIAEDFIGSSRCALALGDNLFYGHALSDLLFNSVQRQEGATIFAYKVQKPQRYGVVEFDNGGKALSIEEKPASPKSRYAVTGLYFYDQYAVELARTLKPSARGELEITDLNREYLKRGMLNVEILGRGMAWLDTGTFESLLDATLLIQTIQKRQGVKIACLEEIAYRKGYITADDLRKLAAPLAHNEYGSYLLELLDSPPL
jgi:glucose-1-phosphate thymidylyltransferase